MLNFLFKLIVRVGGWVGGWLGGRLEKLKIRLNSASVEVVVKVEVEAELGKNCCCQHNR